MRRGKWKSKRAGRWEEKWDVARPLVPVIIGAVILTTACAAVISWWTMDGPVAGVPGCQAAYGRARTATDSARVDALFVEAPWSRSPPVNCGVLRMTDSLRNAHLDSRR